ncbi:MAG TPA: diphthine--ammonia ligase [Spirochaetota bacterium]|nr:diphthine--ammonia ligase [Spirochaetota bacterium]HNT11132.1 diphthine--ammonia ligase [Spirochaetota bacterium]
MKLIASWSGGKDSCLALHRALQAGHEIACLLNFVTEGEDRCAFHGIPSRLLLLQAEAMGIPIVQTEMPRDMAGYESAFTRCVAELARSLGAGGMVFGDIYLDEHREWVERVCGDIGIIALEPLWGGEPITIAREFIDAGFRTTVVSAKADLFTADDVGRDYDMGFVETLVRRGVCPCGENGEFHTFVYDGPLFRNRIVINKTQKTLVDGFWEHWELDIQGFSLSNND